MEKQMEKIVQKIIGFFVSVKQTNLDLFLSSKNVQSPAEVDYWTREYERKTQFNTF
jgi:hypothetical protein